MLFIAIAALWLFGPKAAFSHDGLAPIQWPVCDGLSRTQPSLSLVSENEIGAIFKLRVPDGPPVAIRAVFAPLRAPLEVFLTRLFERASGIRTPRIRYASRSEVDLLLPKIKARLKRLKKSHPLHDLFDDPPIVTVAEWLEGKAGYDVLSSVGARPDAEGKTILEARFPGITQRLDTAWVVNGVIGVSDFRPRNWLAVSDGNISVIDFAFHDADGDQVLRPSQWFHGHPIFEVTDDRFMLNQAIRALPVSVADFIGGMTRSDLLRQARESYPEGEPFPQKHVDEWIQKILERAEWTYNIWLEGNP